MDDQKPTTSGTCPGEAELVPKKYLLVLDVDGTLYDCSEDAQNQGPKAIRPYLQEFLEAVFIYYNIILWSATSLEIVKEKSSVLGIEGNKKYKILDCMSLADMVSASLIAPKELQVKLLKSVWTKYPKYNSRNTVLVDDSPLHISHNSRNGVLVSKYTFTKFEIDRELLYLKKYLQAIAKVDVSKQDHRHWKRTVEAWKN